MEAVPYCYDGDADCWYHALEDFAPLCSSSSSSSSPPAMSVEDHLQMIAAAPSGHLENDLEGSSHGALATDCSSSALFNLGEDKSYYLPMFSAPPPAGDQYCSDQLPPIPADGATAGLDDALLLPFSDIDLEAFGDTGEEHKRPFDDMMIVPADHHIAGQDAGGVDVVHAHHDKPVAIAADYYRPGAKNNGFQMAARHHGEHHQASSFAAPPPPSLPPPRWRRSGDRSSAPAGKTRLDHIGFDELRKYFYMPITRAAREMNVGLTVLKKRCRELGVARWPHRKMKSLKSLILNVQEMGKGMSPAAVQRELAALETYCALMEENPSIELTDQTKKLRQACFKESYKRRRAASANVIDHIYNFGSHDQQLPPPQSCAARHGQSSGFLATDRDMHRLKNPYIDVHGDDAREWIIF